MQGMDNMRSRKQTLTLDASQLWISGIARLTIAYRVMVDNSALGIRSAVTGVDTESVYASFTARTF